MVRDGTTSQMAKSCVPVPRRAVLVSAAGEGQGRGLGEPGAAMQLECVSAEKLMEYLRV